MNADETGNIMKKQQNILEQKITAQEISIIEEKEFLAELKQDLKSLKTQIAKI